MGELPPVLHTALPCRKPTILDGSILIAATAVGFALMKAAHFSFGWVRFAPLGIRLGDCLRMASCFVFVWTFAFFAIRLRRPRPALRALARQPGTIACCAICASTLLGAISSAPMIYLFLTHKVVTFPLQNIAVTTMSNMGIAHSVVAAWVTLFLTGAWRYEKGWIDRMGIVLGVFWVLSLLFLIVTSLL